MWGQPAYIVIHLPCDTHTVPWCIHQIWLGYILTTQLLIRYGNLRLHANLKARFYRKKINVVAWMCKQWKIVYTGNTLVIFKSYCPVEKQCNLSIIRKKIKCSESIINRSTASRKLKQYVPVKNTETRDSGHEMS